MFVLPIRRKKLFSVTKKAFHTFALLMLALQPVSATMFSGGFFVPKAQADEAPVVTTDSTSSDTKTTNDTSTADNADSSKQADTTAPADTSTTTADQTTTPLTTTPDPSTDNTKASDASTNGDQTTVNAQTSSDTQTSGDQVTDTQDASGWKTDGNKATTAGPVELDKTYTAPQNDQVTVKFTKLPDNPGTLSIEEITLTDEQMAETGSLWKHAYDITSDMKDGTFEYELTLPTPKDSSNVQVKYAEDQDGLKDAKTVDSGDLKTDSESVTAKLDHFTTFVVATYSDVTLTTSASNFVPGDTVYVKADTLSNGKYYRTYLTEPGGSVTHTLGGACFHKTGASATFFSASYALPLNAPAGTWQAVGKQYELDTDCASDTAATVTSTPVNVTVQGHVTTNAATGITQTDATLNGTNGNAAASAHSFWVSTAPFSTASPSIPVGVYSTPVLSSLTSNEDFSSTLSSITTSGVPSNLPAITPGTTYYYAAWSEIGATWYPGAVLSFTTASAPAVESCNESTFDGFSTGSVNGQGGWSATGPYDQAIVDNVYGFAGFGCKTLRISDSVTSGSFGDQIFAAPVANAAGEVDATAGSFSEGTRQNHFEAQFDIASVLATEQSGMHASVSPDRGDGSRMSYLRFEDSAGGIDVFFDDVQQAGACAPAGCANFVETQVANNLSRTAPHKVKFDMDFIDGPGNDVVKIYIDGSLVHTGTSWEDYYRFDPESIAEQSPRLVKTLLIRESGSADSGNAGNGFLFDNFDLASSTVVSDTTPPDMPVHVSPANNSFQNYNDFYFQWTDVSDAVEYEFQTSHDPSVDGNGVLTTGVWNNKLNGGPDQNYLTDSEIHSYGADGTWYWQVRARDAANNWSDWTTPWKMTIDMVAPSLPIHVSPADNTFTTTAAQTSIDWSDSVDASPVTYQYQSSNSNATNPDGSFTTPAYTSGVLTDSNIPTPGTPEGVYYWHVKATDAAGNSSGWTTPWKITVDNTAPTVDLVFPTPGPAATSFQAVFSEDVNPAEAEDPANYFLHNWPGVGGSGDLSGHATVSYDSGSHTATVTFTSPGWYISPEQEWGVGNIHDLADNLQSVNPYSETSTPMIAPVTTDTGTDTNWHNSPVTVTLTCDDGDSTVGSGCKTTYYTADGSTPTTSSPHGNSVVVSNEGETTIKYFSVDNAGNAEVPHEAANTVKIDLTAPVTTDSGTDANWHNTDVTVTLSCTDTGTALSGCAHTYYTTDGTTIPTASSPEYTGPITISDEGETTIKYFSVDNAGNAEAVKTAANTVKIDKTLPTVAYAINPNNPDGNNNWYISHPTVTLSATDDRSGVNHIEYRLNGGSWTTYTSPFDLADGTWTVDYRSFDNAHNESVNGTSSAKVDTNDPDNVNHLDATYDNGANEITLDWGVDDPDTYQVYIYRGTSSGFTVDNAHLMNKNDASDENLTDHNPDLGATYWYKVVAVDEAGNHSGAEVIKVEVPAEAGGTATITSQPSQATPQGVLGASTGDNNNADANNPDNGQAGNGDNQGEVLGANTENNDGGAGQRISNFVTTHPWWSWLILLILILLGYSGYRYLNKSDIGA